MRNKRQHAREIHHLPLRKFFGTRDPHLRSRTLPRYRLSVIRISRPLYFAAGWLCFALGAVGVVIPLLPTTPFILLTAFCFSRSSERWHRWLLSNKTFGPMIRDWQASGSIRTRVKVIATTSIVLMLIYPIGFGPVNLYFKIGIVTTVGCVLIFIWTRPSKRLSQDPGAGR